MKRDLLVEFSAISRETCIDETETWAWSNSDGAPSSASEMSRQMLRRKSDDCLGYNLSRLSLDLY